MRTPSRKPATRKSATKPVSPATWAKRLDAKVQQLRQRGAPDEARALLQAHVDDGDVIAMRLLGELLHRDLPADHIGALRAYRAAADRGDDESARGVALLLEGGDDGVADAAALVAFLETQAGSGRPWAVAQLAEIAARREQDARRAARRALSDDDIVRELATRFDLLARVDALRAVARPSVRLLSHPAAGAAAPAASRLGGDPDLPPTVAWPCWQGRPLGFLGQLELGELRAVVDEPSLPAAGLLSFFYAIEAQPWGSPDDHGGWAVVVTPPEAPRARRPPPPDAPSLPPFALEMTRELTLPFVRTVAFRDLGFTDDERRRYDALYAALQDEYRLPPPARGDVHRVLGHPDAIQGDMSRRLEYAARGLDLDGPAIEAAEAAAGRWRFLVQIGSDFNQDMCWGDDGRLFFWIRDEDLAAGRFAAVGLQLQCH